MLSRFVDERITTDRISVWHSVKKWKLNTWKSAAKTIRVKANDKVIELKEDRSLFARMSLVAKSHPEINIKEAVGEFEFNVVPKSMFAPDGSILHCSGKSALIGYSWKLEGLPSAWDPSFTRTNDSAKESIPRWCNGRSASFGKPSWVKNCVHLAQHFTACVFAKYGESEEVRLIFDR